MRFRIFALMVGVAIASVTVFGAALPSSAQVVAPCNASTGTFVQSVGFSGAPILVPMSLPVTTCTLPNNVQVIIPAFQIVGGRSGVIVPSTVRVASCTSGFVAAPSISTVPFVQVVTVTGSTVVVLSTTTPLTVVTPLITCF